MKPIVDSKREETHADVSIPRYGKEKNVQTALMYIKKENEVIKPKTADKSTKTEERRTER